MIFRILRILYMSFLRPKQVIKTTNQGSVGVAEAHRFVPCGLIFIAQGTSLAIASVSFPQRLYGSADGPSL